MMDKFWTRWVVGGIVMLLIVAGACYLWYHYDTAPYRREAAKTEAFARQWEKDQKAQQKRSTETEQATDGTPVESDTQSAVKPINKITGAETDTSTDETTNPVTATPQKTDNAEVRVSPHGFGPYPEVPEGAPLNPFHGNETRDMELLKRVVVKAWNEGERFEGAVIRGETGKVYLNYPNVIYVTYSEDIDEETGEATVSISGIVAGPSLSEEVGRSVLKGNIPAGYTLIDYDKAGIVPSEYLNLTE
ncbi:hypothetical protein C6499_14935 [Candidatus Poribacteria bacterium]|nr:MAG: hypothetical protein C6499_14935 [Candidatus Poribacteria bacterium]